MTEATKDAVVLPVAEKPAATAAPVTEVKPEFRMVATVHGDMHDPHTGMSFTQAPSELLKPSKWVDSQIAAGKMVYTD